MMMPGCVVRLMHVMREMLLAYCRRCGAAYMTGNRRRLYCCDGCRRSFQNERRKRERAEDAQRERKALREREPLASAGCPLFEMDGETACRACAYHDQCGIKGGTPWD